LPLNPSNLNKKEEGANPSGNAPSFFLR